MVNDHHPTQERRRGSSVMTTTTTTTSSLDQSHNTHGHGDGHGDGHGHGRHHGDNKHGGRWHRDPSCQSTSHPYPHARAQHLHPQPHPQASSVMQAQPSPSAPPPPMRLPASPSGSVHRHHHHHHHHHNNNNGQQHTALASAAPVAPEAMLPAEQSLNEWSAFAGGGGSGGGGGGVGGGSGGCGSFGLGPLLFHAGGEHSGDEGLVKKVGGHTPTQQQAGPEQTARKMDLLEMDRLLQNDPISFNPLQAISWANLDDAPMDDGRSLAPASVGMGGERSGSSVGSSQLEERGGLGGSLVVGGKPRSSSRDDYVGPQHVDAQMTSVPVSTRTEPPKNNHNKTCVTPYHIGRGTDHTEPSPSPVGTMSKTFSAVRLQTPDMTAADGRSTFVPPPPPPPPHVSSSSHAAPVVGGGQHGQRQQRKQRHRNGTKTSSHGGPSPVLSEVYQQQQQIYQAPPPPPPPPFAANTPSIQPTFHRFAEQVIDPYNANSITYQTTPPYTIISSSNGSQPQHSLPQPPHPHHQQQQDLFLCLGPYCSARFPTEAELNAHYRAEHSLACSWSSCGAAGFTSNNALVWHVKAEHLLLCPVPGCCDRVFASKKALEGHVRVN